MMQAAEYGRLGRAPKSMETRTGTAIVVADDDGVRVMLGRSEGTIEDALAVADQVLTDGL
jgi:hypothetical protein